MADPTIIPLTDRSLEVWRPFRSGVYEASSLGYIRRAQQGVRGIRTVGRTHVGRLLAQFPDRDGYLKVQLYSERPAQGGSARFSVHRVVAEAFHGPCPRRRQVNHIDGNKQNNRPENLEYTTVRENLRHATRYGLKARGERNRHAKLTAEQVLEIRAAWGNGLANQPALAAHYGVGQGQVSAIVLRKVWAHV